MVLFNVWIENIVYKLISIDWAECVTKYRLFIMISFDAEIGVLRPFA